MVPNLDCYRHRAFSLVVFFFNKHWSYERSNPSKEVDKELLMNITESFVTLRSFLLFIAPLFTKPQLFCSLNNFNCVFFIWVFSEMESYVLLWPKFYGRFFPLEFLQELYFLACYRQRALSLLIFCFFFQIFVFRETLCIFSQNFVLGETESSTVLFLQRVFFEEICFFYSLSMNLYLAWSVTIKELFLQLCFSSIKTVLKRWIENALFLIFIGWW